MRLADVTGIMMITLERGSGAAKQNNAEWRCRMKKVAGFLAVVAVLTVCAGWDQVKRSIYEIHTHTVVVDSAGTINGVAPATVLAGSASGATALQPATFAQVDTNATTTTTGYTPAFVGQVLVGGAGTGTNGVWVAKGVTTNDWVAVH